MKREVKTILFIILAVGVSLGFFIHQNYKADTRVYSALPDLLTPAPSPIQTTSMDSPDGTKTLTMEKQEIKDSARYSFFTSVKSENTKQTIFTKEVTSSQNLSIPYNAWSPDNVYIFLKEATPIENSYYVFFASGNNFSDNSQYLNIQTIFTKKIPGYTILDVTGWAAPNLLIVNTKEIQGEKKVSFWFDVASQSFLQLGTYFY